MIILYPYFKRKCEQIKHDAGVNCDDVTNREDKSHSAPLVSGTVSESHSSVLYTHTFMSVFSWWLTAQWDYAPAGDKMLLNHQWTGVAPAGVTLRPNIVFSWKCLPNPWCVIVIVKGNVSWMEFGSLLAITASFPILERDKESRWNTGSTWL